ncbi:MAG: hypothetical protein Q8P67_25680 [archaeon]|nr:hypothetical protein [archaeon]
MKEQQPPASIEGKAPKTAPAKPVREGEPAGRGGREVRPPEQKKQGGGRPVERVRARPGEQTGGDFWPMCVLLVILLGLVLIGSGLFGLLRDPPVSEFPSHLFQQSRSRSFSQQRQTEDKHGELELPLSVFYTGLSQYVPFLSYLSY